jgi:hypothetical protein
MGERIKLGQILLDKGLIAREQLSAALGEQRQWGNRLGATIVGMGFLDEETLVRTLASQLRVPVARIKGKTVNPEVLAAVPLELAEKYRCMPLFHREDAGGRVLYLGMEDPSDLAAVDELSKTERQPDHARLGRSSEQQIVIGKRTTGSGTVL